EHGYLAAQNDTSDTKFFSTSDGGATWRPVPGASRRATSQVTWVDPQHGIADEADIGPGGYAGGDRLFRTSDGGRTWPRVALAGRRPSPGGLEGIGPVGGTLVAPAERSSGSPKRPSLRPIVYTSSDGGAHWQTHAVPAQVYLVGFGLDPRPSLFS